MHVLVIDDSKAIRHMLSTMLLNQGFEVHNAANGREALDILAKVDHIDLAFVDWNMPEMDGYEFIQTVRAEPAYNDVRLMMVTTESDRDRLVESLAAGANEYIIKPFTKEAILEKMALVGIGH